MNAAKREIAEEKKRQTQKIRIGVYAYAFESFVLPNLANAIENHVFECRIWDSARLKAELSKGTLDVIFTDRAPEEDEVEVVRLFKEQIMVSLPSSSEFASRQSLFHSDLAKLNPYLPFDASGYTKWFEQVLKAAGVEAPLANGVSFKEYLYTKDSLERSHMTSSFIMRFLPTAARRVLIPLTEEIGTRDIYMAYQKRSADRLKPLLAYIQTYQDRLFTGSAFLPYFLFPSEQSNLLFCPDSE